MGYSIMKAISGLFIIKVAGLVFGLVLLLVFLNIMNGALHTECWNNVEGELNKVTGYVGFGLLGRSCFQIGIIAGSSCLDKIVLEDYDDCKNICNDFSGDKNKCRSSCETCKDSRGCIIAVPKMPSGWEYWKAWKWLDTWRARATNIKTYRVNEYGFQGTTTISGPERGTDVYCIKFKMVGSRTPEPNYDITYEKVDRKGDCIEAC